jgi:hypothetical protein
MNLSRRGVIGFVLAGLVAATSKRARAVGLKQAKEPDGMPAELPPFELQASSKALQRLTDGLSGWRVERVGKSASHVWLRNSDGAVWLVGVDQRDVKPLFEVFTLDMLSMDELNEQWRRWKPPTLPQDMPESFRQLLTTRPPAPVAPTEFDSWPFRSWRTEVVRRAEFIVEIAADSSAFGDTPNTQSAVPPKGVPPEASAFCEVAAGILFTGDNGHKLLLAVDWMPMNMLVMDDAAEIDAFTSTCELVGMADYISGTPAAR